MKPYRALRRSVGVAAVALAAAPLFAGASFGVALPAPPPPATPGNVALLSANRSIAVTWTESSSGSVNFVATAKAAGKPTRVCRTTADGCSIVSLANGTIYVVTVVAKNKGGVSNPSAPQTALVGVPGAPLSVRATAGTAMATVSWAPPKASGVTNVTGYHVTTSPGGFELLDVGHAAHQSGEDLRDRGAGERHHLLGDRDRHQRVRHGPALQAGHGDARLTPRPEEPHPRRSDPARKGRVAALWVRFVIAHLRGPFSSR